MTHNVRMKRKNSKIWGINEWKTEMRNPICVCDYIAVGSSSNVLNVKRYFFLLIIFWFIKIILSIFVEERWYDDRMWIMIIVMDMLQVSEIFYILNYFKHFFVPYWVYRHVKSFECFSLKSIWFSLNTIGCVVWIKSLA